MLDLGFSRALVISTLTLATTFTAGTALAEDPPPPPTLPVAPAAVAPAAPPAEAKAPPPAGRNAGLWDSRPAGYDASMAAYGVPGTAIPFELRPDYPPEMHARSSGMVAGGVVLLSFGMVGLFAGSAMVSAHDPAVDTPNTCFDCGFEGSGPRANAPTGDLKPGFVAPGIVTLVGSVAAIGAAIPLIVIGATKVPYADAASPAAKAATLTPILRVGAASATVTWQF